MRVLFRSLLFWLFLITGAFALYLVYDTRGVILKCVEYCVFNNHCRYEKPIMDTFNMTRLQAHQEFDSYSSVTQCTMLVLAIAVTGTERTIDVLKRLFIFVWYDIE